MPRRSSRSDHSNFGPPLVPAAAVGLFLLVIVVVGVVLIVRGLSTP